MNWKRFLALAVTIGLTLFDAAWLGAQADAGPTAIFPQTLYEFSAVLDGAKVVHEFVVQNKGTSTLNIERVKTG